MKTYTEQQFLRWAGNRGIVIDSQYPKSAVLDFVSPKPESDRFWEIPAEPERRPYFISTILQAMGDWESCYVWRHMGSWPARPDPQRLNDRIEFVILKSIGLPLGTADVVEFNREEADSLIALVFSTSIFGWSVNEDLYIIPDTARYIAKTDHHGVIHVAFENPDTMRAFIEFMEENDFFLPEELLDDTFKRPEWMKK